MINGQRSTHEFQVAMSILGLTDHWWLSGEVAFILGMGAKGIHDHP
jgi:hypothetical protein